MQEQSHQDFPPRLHRRALHHLDPPAEGHLPQEGRAQHHHGGLVTHGQVALVHHSRKKCKVKARFTYETVAVSQIFMVFIHAELNCHL